MSDVIVDIFFRAANAFSSVVHERNMISPLPDVVYHYTTGAGLKGIIESGEIWGNCFGYMNDSTELLLGLKYINDAVDYCEYHLGPNDPSFSIQTDLILLLRQCLNKRGRFDAFGCCFADDGDKLSQWRGYAAQGQGYSIGFRFERPDQHLSVRTILAQVIYDVAAQRLAATTMINNILTEIPQRLSEADYNSSREHIMAQIQLSIDLTFPQLKHKGFDEEGESRLIVSGEDEPEVSSPGNFLERNGMLSPYIRIRPKDGDRLPIIRIIVGPSLNFERAKHSIQKLLAKNLYASAEIEQSKIPFLP